MRRSVLGHHQATPAPVVLAHPKFEGGLGHVVRVLVELLEDNLVRLTWLNIAEEAEIDDEARINVLCDRAI